MADAETKARQKLAEAEKKGKKSGGFFNSLFGGGSDETADLYIQAGNLFKVAKNWHSAGDSFLKAAEFHNANSEHKHDAATNFGEAGNCYRKVDPQKAVNCVVKTADIYTDMGRFNMAAKSHTIIAEIYENEFPNKELCMKHYQVAADFYKGEEAKSSATKCLIKVATLAAELEQYKKAIDIFEEIAIWEADHPTLKYAAKNHFFQALLCNLCLDLIGTQHAVKRYEEISPSFSDSREAKFIRELILCAEEQNADAYTEKVREFDKISRIDPWATSLLLKIKNSIGGGNDEDEEDLR